MSTVRRRESTGVPITRAGNGVGRATARWFASEGAWIVVGVAVATV